MSDENQNNNPDEQSLNYADTEYRDGWFVRLSRKLGGFIATHYSHYDQTDAEFHADTLEELYDKIDSYPKEKLGPYETPWSKRGK